MMRACLVAALLCGSVWFGHASANMKFAGVRPWQGMLLIMTDVFASLAFAAGAVVVSGVLT